MLEPVHLAGLLGLPGLCGGTGPPTLQVPGDDDDDGDDYDDDDDDNDYDELDDDDD